MPRFSLGETVGNPNITMTLKEAKKKCREFPDCFAASGKLSVNKLNETRVDKKGVWTFWKKSHSLKKMYAQAGYLALVRRSLAGKGDTVLKKMPGPNNGKAGAAAAGAAAGGGRKKEVSGWTVDPQTGHRVMYKLVQQTLPEEVGDGMHGVAPRPVQAGPANCCRRR